MISRICLFETQYSLMNYMFLDKRWKERTYILTSERLCEIVYRMSHLKVNTSYSIFLQKINLLFEDKHHYIWKKIMKIFRYYLYLWGLKHKSVPVYGQDHNFFARCFFNREFNEVEDGNISYESYEFFLTHGIEKNWWKRYVCFGWSDYVNKVYLTGRLPIPEGLQHKVEIIDLKSSWASLNENEKKDIFYVLGYNEDKVNALISSGRTNILLTQPFYLDNEYGREAHIVCYTEILKKYDMNTIIIKPHPEDKLNYKEIFPKCEILSERFPFELCYFIGVPFTKIISVNSTSTMKGLWDKEYIDTYEYMIDRMKKYKKK